MTELDGIGGDKKITFNCPECGSNTWKNPEGYRLNKRGVHRICDNCGQEYFTNIDYSKRTSINTQQDSALDISEDSGGSVSYYELRILEPNSGGSYRVECLDIMEALEMTIHENNIFKAIWRMAAERQGKKKTGNSALRDAEKIAFFANRLLYLETIKWRS